MGGSGSGGVGHIVIVPAVCFSNKSKSGHCTNTGTTQSSEKSKTQYTEPETPVCCTIL